MARSRSFALCLLITRMFMFLLICFDNLKAAMGYYLLLGHVLLLVCFTQYHCDIIVNKLKVCEFQNTHLYSNTKYAIPC
jgi:hypothetical protein